MKFLHILKRLVRGGRPSKSPNRDVIHLPDNPTSTAPVNTAPDSLPVVHEPHTHNHEGESSHTPMHQFAPMSLHFVQDKIPSKGEDAPPICTIDINKGLIAVFDGMGGSGSAKYTKQADTEEVFSGAYLASRFTRDILDEWYTKNFRTPEVAGFTPDQLTQLKAFLQAGLAHKLADYSAVETFLKSNMLHSLPTTMASVFFEQSEDQITYDIVWAGDSRAYRLHVEGLQQLSIDDANNTNGETLTKFMQDSPMTNCISIDRDFRLNHRQLTSSYPIILCVATDGCFQYLPSPMHFEYLLLDALMHTTTPDEWALLMSQKLKPIAGDDYSMALACFGWADFKSMQHTLQSRHTAVQHLLMKFDEQQQAVQQIAIQIQQLTNEQVQRKTSLESLFHAYWLNYQVRTESHTSSDPLEQ